MSATSSGAPNADAGQGHLSESDGLMTMYVTAQRRHWTEKTRRKVDWALFVLWQAHPDRLPRDPRSLAETVRAAALAPNSRRVVYGTWRTFYRWLREHHDPTFPDPPHVFFGTRRNGEKRGGARPWQRR